MGAGKSSTARVLAHETGLFAIDTDDLIESYINCSISSLFATQGEAAFRQLEQHVANWIEASVQHTIISTGGGFFMVNNLLNKEYSYRPMAVAAPRTFVLKMDVTF